MKVKKKNVENLSEALKANLRRRKAERKNDDSEKDNVQDNTVTTKKII